MSRFEANTSAIDEDSDYKDPEIDPPDKLLDSSGYHIAKIHYNSSHQADTENSNCYDFQNSKLVFHDSSNQTDIQMVSLAMASQRRRHSYEDKTARETDDETSLSNTGEENNSNKLKECDNDGLNEYTEKGSVFEEKNSGCQPYAESNFKVINNVIKTVIIKLDKFYLKLKF